MKAIIPVAGTGSRLRPHTHTQPKALIPLAGKPILGYILDEIISAGITDFVFIIGYLGEKIRDYVADYYPHINARYVEQTIRRGIGHAIWLARPHVAPDEPIFIALGDGIFDVHMQELMQNSTSLLCVKKVDDPLSFGVVEMNEKTGLIHQLVEKPQFPKSNLALVGLYKIEESTKLFDALDFLVRQHEGSRQEVELTDALMHMIQQGVPLYAYKINNWFDCGKKEQLIETNAILLRKQGSMLHPSARIVDSVLIDPVSIGAHCVLNRCIIGPHVTIGNHASISGCIISNSIVGSHSVIEHVMLDNSVTGNDTTISGVYQTLNLGDDTEINIR